MKSLLLVGSPRKEHSSSHVLGTYLQEELAARGAGTETRQLYPALVNATRRAALIDALRAADLVLLVAPLYVDAQPAVVAELMELVAREAAAGWPAGQRWFFLSNSGFPEREHNDVVLSIYRQFCRQVGLTWAGGLGLGGGPMVNQRGGDVGMPGGAPLRTAGKMVQSIRDGLDLAVEALAAGEPVPAKAQKLFDKPLAPAGLYRLIANLGWVRASLQKGTWRRLLARPYARKA